MKPNNLIGQRFGSLIVIEKDTNQGSSKWVCKCDCGQTKVVYGSNLMSGKTTSCGCSKKKHGESKSPLYNVYNQKKLQGMCEEWADDYSKFKEWANNNGYKDNSRIEKIDKTKPSSPENCIIIDGVDEYKSFLKTVGGGEGDRCLYPTRLDMYGKGCQHNCEYCYARSLLDFRGLWNEDKPSCADKEKVKKALDKIEKGTILRLGGMTDPYQPLEAEKGLTRWLIGELNERGIGYLIVTKSALIERDIDILDKNLAHVQISYTYSEGKKPSTMFENASDPSERLRVADALYDAGIDVQIRLSPYIPKLIDLNCIKNSKVEKLVVEFLRVNSMIFKKMPWLVGDKYMWSEKSGNYYHIPLDNKIDYLAHIKAITKKTITVCEDEPRHYEVFKTGFNPNQDDCCNLRK